MSNASLVEIENAIRQLHGRLSFVERLTPEIEAFHLLAAGLLTQISRQDFGRAIMADAFEVASDLAIARGLRHTNPFENASAQKCMQALETIRAGWASGLPPAQRPRPGALRFVHVAPDRIAAEWPQFSQMLAPAVRQDPTQTLEGLRKRLESGADGLIEVSGPGHCFVVVEVTSDLVCWTKYIGGFIDGGPKARAALMRQALTHLEAVAKAAGCIEHRLCGRDFWPRLLPDYEPLDGWPNGLKKEL